jgi:hypothetical protein
VVVFLSEKEEGLYHLNKTMVLQPAPPPAHTSHGEESAPGRE